MEYNMQYRLDRSRLGKRSTRREFLVKTARSGAAAMALAARGTYASKLPAKPDRFLPNIVLIVIDTLRADHLSCYGYHRRTSPWIDLFAQRASFHTRSVASSPWTLPTHASLFTGKYPFEHGAHTFKLGSDKVLEPPLSTRYLTLAEALKAEGYQTGAVVANPTYLRRRFSLHQGFETYQVKRLHADELNKRVFEWLEGHYTQPFFLFINYMDTHSPYNTRPRQGLLDKPLRDSQAYISWMYAWVMSGKRTVPERLVQSVTDQYDTAVANVDEQVGALLAWLAGRDLFHNTFIVLTSDHGEYLGEHSLVEHSKDIYEEAVWVPLITKEPGQYAGRVIDRLVSSTDIPHMILSELPEDIAERYAGTFSNEGGDHPVISENYYTRGKDLFHKEWGHRFDRVRTAMYQWPHKFIRSSDGNHELYNLAEDPRESANLAKREQETATLLAQKLEKFEASRERAEPATLEMPDLTEEERRDMEALGYL